MSVSAKKTMTHSTKDDERKIILVGTYVKGQLKKWPGYYNYPIYDGDKIDVDTARRINEIWLFNGADNGKFFVVEFVGIKTREELKNAYGYPAKGKGHGGGTYLLFKTTEMVLYSPTINPDDRVIVRTKDFSRRSSRIAKLLKVYLESSGRECKPLVGMLPAILTKLPSNILFVCEEAIQLDFLSILYPGIDMNCTVPVAIRNHKLSLIDLFAGCGGMSLGFELAGFLPVLAVEKDAWASETYACNRFGVKVVTNDITKIAHPKKEYAHIGDVFGIIGGPPCQGFSLSGDRDPKDPRNSLFMDYMRFVKDFKPSFFVMENVPGILSSVTKKGESVKDVIVTVSNKLGYNVKIMQLDASHYGVPQSRVRVFFVGIRNDYPFDADRLTPVKITEDNPITIRQAISDLPAIKACEGAEDMPYETAPCNEYQRWCREGSQTVRNHVAMRHTQRLVARFHVIQYGESAADVPQEHMQRKRGNAAVISGKVYSQNNMRPFPDRPSPTVPASFQSNFVHPFFDRNYTAREGARLQSFPDRYVFCGRRTTMSWEKNLSQYQQIGNAVPPLLARAIGEMIKNYFTDIENVKDRK